MLGSMSAEEEVTMEVEEEEEDMMERMMDGNDPFEGKMIMML